MRFRSLFVPVLAAGLVLGCGDDDDPAGPGGGNPAPDLTGTYTMVSFSQAGITLMPPAVMGTFTITQTAATGTGASGDVSLDITVPDGLGGTNNIVDTGTYAIDSSGTWMQTGQATGGASGTFTLVGGTLTVDTTTPAIAANITVWQRQ